MRAPRPAWIDVALSSLAGVVLALLPFLIVAFPLPAFAQLEGGPEGGGPSPVLVDGVCLPDSFAAMNYMARQRSGHVVVSGGYLYVTAASTMSGDSLIVELVPINGGPYLDTAEFYPPVVFCSGQYTHEEGLQLGGLVMVAFASVFAIKFLARAITRRDAA